jgi:hypothetical protein
MGTSRGGGGGASTTQGPAGQSPHLPLVREPRHQPERALAVPEQHRREQQRRPVAAAAGARVDDLQFRERRLEVRVARLGQPAAEGVLAGAGLRHQEDAPGGGPVDVLGVKAEGDRAVPGVWVVSEAARAWASYD